MDDDDKPIDGVFFTGANELHSGASVTTRDIIIFRELMICINQPKYYVLQQLTTDNEW